MHPPATEGDHFLEPGLWGFASDPHAPRRSRLAGTPAGVSDDGTGL